ARTVGLPGRAGEVPDRAQVVRDPPEPPAEPPPIAETPRENLGLAKPVETLPELAEPHQRRLLVQDRVDDTLGAASSLGKVCEAAQRLVEAGDGLAIGGTLPRREAGIAEITRGVVPHLGVAVAQPERHSVRVEAAGVERLDALGHPAMEQPAPRGEDASARDLTDPIVGEVESLAASVEHAAAHGLLAARRGLFLLEPRRSLKERELEFAPDDGRDGRECLPAVGQSL